MQRKIVKKEKEIEKKRQRKELETEKGLNI